jgi:hypothetical protein
MRGRREHRADSQHGQAVAADSRGEVVLLRAGQEIVAVEQGDAAKMLPAPRGVQLRLLPARVVGPPEALRPNLVGAVENPLGQARVCRHEGCHGGPSIISQEQSCTFALYSPCTRAAAGLSPLGRSMV